jgi:hypothetical protein
MIQVLQNLPILSRFFSLQGFLMADQHHVSGKIARQMPSRNEAVAPVVP